MGIRAVTAVVAVLLLAGCSAGTRSPDDQPAVTPAPASTPAPAIRYVTYQVTGETPTADLTVAMPSGSTQHDDVQVSTDPVGRWDERVQLAPGSMAYVSAQASSTATDVTCVIIVEGIEQARNTATGPHSIATCQYVIP